MLRGDARGEEPLDGVWLEIGWWLSVQPRSFSAYKRGSLSVQVD